jgi:hypothetical protein
METTCVSLGAGALSAGAAWATSNHPVAGFIAGGVVGVSLMLSDSVPQSVIKKLGTGLTDIITIALAVLASAGLTKLACEYVLKVPLTFTASLYLPALPTCTMVALAIIFS